MFNRNNYSPPPLFYVNTFFPALCIFLFVEPNFVGWSEGLGHPGSPDLLRTITQEIPALSSFSICLISAKQADISRLTVE
jgi:hypothetical protein